MKELGELVRGARQQKGVTLDQASAETRIRRQYLDAIEDGDFRMFPGGAYATGFLRNYATYLGLNPDEILQTYHAISPHVGISIEPATTVGVERLKRRSRRRFLWIFATAMAMVLAAFAIQRYNSEQHAAATPPRPPAQTAGIGGGQITRHGRPSADQALHRLVQHHRLAMIRVRARHTAWVHVKVDGTQVYWGPVYAGAVRRWAGKRVSISTHRGRALKVWADGRRMGLMSHSRGRTVIVARPHGRIRRG